MWPPKSPIYAPSHPQNRVLHLHCCESLKTEVTIYFVQEISSMYGIRCRQFAWHHAKAVPCIRKWVATLILSTLPYTAVLPCHKTLINIPIDSVLLNHDSKSKSMIPHQWASQRSVTGRQCCCHDNSKLPQWGHHNTGHVPTRTAKRRACCQFLNPISGRNCVVLRMLWPLNERKGSFPKTKAS